MNFSYRWLFWLVYYFCKVLVFFHFLKFHMYSHPSYLYRLSEDTAWHPVWKEEFDSSPVLRKAIIYGYGPFRTWMSIAHWCVTKYRNYTGHIYHVTNFSWPLLSTVTTSNLGNHDFLWFYSILYVPRH